MSEVATAELGLATAAVATDNGGDSDVFLSLRDGTVGEDFSSGIDDIGEEVNISTDEAAGKLDLVAVAGGEEELPSTEKVSASIGQTACVTCVGCPFLSQCIKPQALAVKQESERQDNVSDDMNSADEEAVPNLMEMTPKQSYLDRLLASDDFDSLDENGRGELVMAEYSRSTDYQESITKKAPEPAAAETKPIDLTTKTDEPTEQIVQQERETKTSTNETVEASGKDVDTETTETLFFELKTASETAADDTTDAGEALPESASKVLSGTSGEEHFTEPTEESRPSIEIKQQASDVISSAVDKENQQPAFDFPDIPTQTKTRTVLSSPGVSEDTQTGDESCNSLENKTVYLTASEDKVAASVVENTYDGDENTASSSIKTPSIEYQEENEFVITGSKSANSEPSRAAENDESATPVSEQQHLAAQFEAVKVDESATMEPIDNSGTKASTDAQSSELSIDAAPDYDNFVESTDDVDAEQPKHVTSTAANVPPSQEQEDAVNTSAEYETNETSTEKMVNVTASIPAKEQPDQPAIALSSIQDVVEYGESLLSAGKECTVDRSPIRPDDVVSIPTTHEAIEATHEAGETIELEAMNVTPPADVAAVSEGKSQIDLPPELNDKLAVEQRVYEVQTSPVEQLDYSDAAGERYRGRDDEVWAEEEAVFFVEQQPSAAESEVPSAEAVAVALSTEAVALRKETDDLEPPVDDEIGVDVDSVGQLDNSKVASVPEITNDYESVERIAIPTSPAIELIPDVKLDEPAVEILEERIMPREERDNMTVKTSEKSDLLSVDNRVEYIGIDIKDVESAIDLPETQEELTTTEVAEAAESEADEQNDLATVNGVVDDYGYEGEASFVNDYLIMNTHPSSGLWSDDSRLNLEEEFTTTTQSSADDTSLVSRLVGMFVVAMCVVRGRQSVKV